jgi:hypothetical protein
MVVHCILGLPVSRPGYHYGIPPRRQVAHEMEGDRGRRSDHPHTDQVTSRRGTDPISHRRRRATPSLTRRASPQPRPCAPRVGWNDDDVRLRYRPEVTSEPMVIHVEGRQPNGAE